MCSAWGPWCLSVQFPSCNKWNSSFFCFVYRWRKRPRRQECWGPIKSHNHIRQPWLRVSQEGLVKLSAGTTDPPPRWLEQWLAGLRAPVQPLARGSVSPRAASPWWPECPPNVADGFPQRKEGKRGTKAKPPRLPKWLSWTWHTITSATFCWLHRSWDNAGDVWIQEVGHSGAWLSQVLFSFIIFLN